MRVTGIPGIDALLRPVRPGWIIEVYGSQRLVDLVMHHAIAAAAQRGRVAVVHVQDFGGLNPYIIRRLLRRHGGTLDNVLVARAFRLQDVPALIREALTLGIATLVVRAPYYYAPGDWRQYGKLTPVTASLRQALTRGVLTLVFNTPSRYGRSYLPEGGQFHHHTVHSIVRLDPWRKGVLATLVKHPWKPVPRHARISHMELGMGSWVGQSPLTEYL